ncbi:DBH-like monooxygenase protein 1 [Centruroides vittatus]|uniref:DBH-like monooxygenase protein 1 n=1 Tax=Centruroides vittatus TaxID=120091 RepID=UPI0035101C91
MSVLAFLVLCIITVSARNFDRHSKLDDNYEIWWSTDEDSITFQVEVATRGWVGLGISPNGGMEGSDVVIGWINNGKATFHDRYARGKFLPEIDEHQDWELLWYQQTDTHTKFRFKRFLIPCDSQDLNITDDTTRLIFAYNDENPGSTGEISYHGSQNRGTKSVVLLNYSKNIIPEDPSDLYHWEVRHSNVRIPDDSDTEYYCKFFRVPKLNRKHHIIHFSTVIEPGNEKFVHHMILYECTGVETEKIAPYLNEEYTECYTKDNLPKFPFCFTLTYGWAVGGDTFIFPDQVGLPLGIPEVKWLLLETHYDNPSLKRGIVDNSGFRITYTPKLRKHDAAVLAVGNLWYPCVFIPPKQKEYIVAGHAHPSCLRQRVPPEGIKMYAFLLHSHLIGKKLKVRHFRNGEELLPLARDLNYDFDFQQFKYLPEERTVLPSDHLVVECTYDSSRRAKVTFVSNIIEKF